MIPALLSALGARRLVQWWPLSAVAALVLALSPHIPIGGDFYWYYYKVPQDWLAGETRLYDSASRGYFLPPWGIWPYLPLALLDAFLANAIATLIAAVIIGGIAYHHSRALGAQASCLPVALLASLCPYSLVLYLTGTPDAWSLLGLWLAWLSARKNNGWALGLGAALALVRPQNCLLSLPALVAQALLPVRTGTLARAPVVRAAAVLALVLLASVFVSGPDWPVRWWENYFIRPPSPEGAATTYSALQRIHVPLWLSGAAGLAAALYAFGRYAPAASEPRTFELLVALNGVLTPFLRSPGYVVLLAIPWAGLAARRPRLAAAVYAVSLPTILVPLWWEGLAPIWPYVPYFDLLFPIGLVAALLHERRMALSAQVFQAAPA